MATSKTLIKASQRTPAGAKPVSAATVRNPAKRPEEYRYATWSIDTPAIRAAFGGVISTGLVPQVLEAYGEDNNLIHPSHAATKLRGAITHVTYTTERSLFTSPRFKNRAEWQFYANILTVQILTRPPTLPSRPKNFMLSFLKRAHVLKSEGGSSRKAKRANTAN
ncbi:hypothetical protein FRC12_023727 [Ceratobasidium sp. 428]|nr:hypothetical protein FRC12_023727 [Ceratobasidium sp. 428]